MQTHSFLRATLLLPLALASFASANTTPPSNDLVELTPRIDYDQPVLRYDFPTLHAGIAEYEEGPTGCTVFYFSKRARATVDLRTGANGTHEIGRLLDRVGYVDAICFAGGSAYGLEACTGVAAELFKRRGYSPQWDQIALVSGAIIYDYARRNTAIYPDKALGRAAFNAAQTGVFPIGPQGAGRMASVGADRAPSGQGAAFRKIGDARLAVFTVVNASGVVVDRQGNVVRGKPKGAPAPGNTTLTLVATNVRLTDEELRHLAAATHASLARAIRPFHTPVDGDLLFAATTDETDERDLSLYDIVTLAGDLAWDAVLTAVSYQPPDRNP